MYSCHLIKIPWNQVKNFDIPGSLNDAHSEIDQNFREINLVCVDELIWRIFLQKMANYYSVRVFDKNSVKLDNFFTNETHCKLISRFFQARLHFTLFQNLFGFFFQVMMVTSLSEVTVKEVMEVSKG